LQHILEPVVARVGFIVTNLGGRDAGVARWTTCRQNRRDVVGAE